MRQTRNVAVAVRCIRGTACARKLGPWGTGELPNHRLLDAALARRDRSLGKHAAGGGWPGIIHNPQRGWLSLFVLENLACGRDFAGPLRNRNPGTINARPKLRGAHSLQPGEQVSSLVGRQPATLFLIQE